MLDAELTDIYPPGPTDPDDEQCAQFLRDPFGYVETMAAAHGTIFSLRLGALGNDDVVDVESNGDWVFLSRPHQLRIMYETDEGSISGALANKLFFGTEEESVGYIDGKPHRRRRSQLQPFLSGSRDYVALVTDVLDRRMKTWPRGTEFALFPELQRVTAEVIIEVCCGNFGEEDKERLCELLLKTENARYTEDEVIAADAAIRKLVDERIEGHLARAERIGRHDVLATLLKHAADGDIALSPEVVRDELFSLFYTGFATTANTLSWAFIRILNDDRVHQKLLREFGDDFRSRPLTRESFADRPYLEATITETLRLHPVSALNGVRMVTAPVNIDGYTIKPGTVLVHCAHLLQRSPEFYADPLEFRPERFVGTTVPRYVFGAFGGGHRMCVGRGYAKEEMKMIVPIVLSNLRLKLVGGLPKAQQQGFFMAPADGARCVIEDVVED